MTNNKQFNYATLRGSYIDTYDIRRIINIAPVFYSDLEPETQINIIDPLQGDVQINLSMVSTKLLIEKLQSIYFFNQHKESK